MTRRQRTSRRRFWAPAATAGAVLLPGIIGRAAPPAPPPTALDEHFWYASSRLASTSTRSEAVRHSPMRTVGSFFRRQRTHLAAQRRDARRPADHLQPHSQQRQRRLRHRREALPQHGPLEDVPRDHGESGRRLRLRPHAPKNPDNPGWYFHTLPGVVSWDIGGREIMVWATTATWSAAPRR